MARFEISIPRDTRAGYFLFPNTYFNYLIFRDERTVNVTAIVEWSLILNGTNVSLIDKFKNSPLRVMIYTENKEFL